MNETTPMESTDVETVPTESATVATESTDPAPTDATIPETGPDATQETEVDPTQPTTPENVKPYPEDLYNEDQEGTQATIYEDFSGSEVAATEEVTVIEVIETVGSDISHATLFSGFLVCGTLVGLALLRKIYGT